MVVVVLVFLSGRFVQHLTSNATKFKDSIAIYEW